MKKHWKDIEGRKVRIDVGSSSAEALDRRFPAESIAFTTDNQIVLNGETFGSVMYRVSGVVGGGQCEAMSTTDESGSVVYMSDHGVFAYYATDGNFYNNWTDPLWPRSEYPPQGTPPNKGALIAASGELSIIDNILPENGIPAIVRESGLYRTKQDGKAILLFASASKNKALEERLAKAEETIEQLKVLLLMEAKE